MWRMAGEQRTDVEEEEKVQSFLQWAASIGITDSTQSSSSSHSTSSCCLGHSLELSHFPDAGGRGLAAARELRRGEMVLRVPRSTLLTRENVLRDRKLASSFSRHTQLSPSQLLTVCLLTEAEKGKASWWYPFLLQLPRSYDTLSNFTQFEIQAFQVDYAIWVSEKAVSKAKLDWKQSLGLMQEIKLKPQLQTFKSWLWASATVSSRALHVPWDSAGCLCPVGDLFNYSAPEDCSLELSDGTSCHWEDSGKKFEQFNESSWRLTDGGYDEGLDSYCFYARKRYKKGEQVLLCYGTYTNLELLEHYGFLLNTNGNEKTFIQLNTVLQISNKSWPKDSLYIQQDGKPSFALMSSLRQWATPTKLRREVGHLIYSGSQLSSENEMIVMKFMSKKCRDILDELPVSAEDDAILLDIIEKILDCSTSTEGLDITSCAYQEAKDFLQLNGLEGREVASSWPVKVQRSAERWKLAVKWRLNYKRALLNCNIFCNEVIDSLK